eukprot:11512533-Ditylum_brightwellii.AAC.1
MEPWNKALASKRNIEDASLSEKSSIVEGSNLGDNGEARANYKLPSFTKKERSICPSEWISISDLVENKDALE